MSDWPVVGPYSLKLPRYISELKLWHIICYELRLDSNEYNRSSYFCFIEVIFMQRKMVLTL